MPGHDGARTLLGASAISAGVVGVTASVAALARRAGKIPLTDEQRARLERRSTDPNGPRQRERGGRDQGSPQAGSGTADKPEPGKAPAPDDPRKPEGPEDLKKPTFVYSLKKTLREFGSDQCTDLAAALVYYAVLAMFPALLAIVSILGLFGQATTTTSTVLGILQGVAPDLAKTLGPVVASLTRSPAAGFTFVIGIVGALWSASGYVGAFGRALNRVYSIPEGRPAWKLRPTQLLVTIAVVVLVVIGALILVLSGPVADAVGGKLGLGPAAVLVFSIVKWPILLVIAIATVAILYYFSPNVRQPKFKWTSLGSVLALVVWALGTVAFGFYVANFGNYNKTYGSIAGVIVFLLWLWITNLALLFGAEFDAELERSRELQGGIAAEEQIQLPMRDTRQSDKKEKKREADVAAGRRLRESRGRQG
ncbi:MAG: rane protein [Microbacteriaceae bacterium]|nr:rane protein [Microbacteriaceae bacterium]